jgi:hypothetical protein
VGIFRYAIVASALERTPARVDITNANDNIGGTIIIIVLGPLLFGVAAIDDADASADLVSLSMLSIDGDMQSAVIIHRI